MVKKDQFIIVSYNFQKVLSGDKTMSSQLDSDYNIGPCLIGNSSEGFIEKEIILIKKIKAKNITKKDLKKCGQVDKKKWISLMQSFFNDFDQDSDVVLIEWKL